MRQIVKPEVKDSCGVCAVACLTGVTWKEADYALFPELEHPISRSFDRGTYGSRLIRGLKELGWLVTQKKMKGMPLKTPGWEDLARIVGQRFAIVKVQYENAKSGHWVVFAEDYIYDSNFESRWCPMEYPYAPLGYVIAEPPEVKMMISDLVEQIIAPNKILDDIPYEEVK